jgi:hypothetical protein
VVVVGEYKICNQCIVTPLSYKISDMYLGDCYSVYDAENI